MAEQTAINIGLHIDQIVIDLRIPRFVTMEQLQSIIAENITELFITLPKKWELELIDKNVKIQPHITLDEYPLSDGDQLKIKKCKS